MSCSAWRWYFTYNRVLHLKNTLCTLSKGLGISCNACFYLQYLARCLNYGALLDLPSCKSESWRRYTCTNVVLVCEGGIGELGEVGNWGLEVCFVGLALGRYYVWCLVIVVIFMRFGQAGAKSCGDAYIVLYCETLLQVLLCIYCNWFYWIPLFTILLLLYVFEVGKAKSVTQSVLIRLTLNGLFQKIF